MFFISMVLHPELNAKIDLMVDLQNLLFVIRNIYVVVFFPLVWDRQVALAPLSSFQHFDAIFRILTPFSNPIEVCIQCSGS